MMQYLALVVLALVIGAFVWRTFSRGKLRVAARVDAVLEAADATAVLVIARAVLPWGHTGTWWWYLALVALTIGVVRVVLIWPALPSVATAGRRATRITAVVHALILVAVLALFLL